MPRNPYSISGIIYDCDGSTKMTSGYVRVLDVNLGEYITINIAADGSFDGDLANLASAYSNGDIIFVTAYDTNKSRCTEFRHVVDTSSPGSDGTYYMHWGIPILGPGDSTITALSVSNRHASNDGQVDFYDKQYGYKRHSVEVASKGNASQQFLFKGIPCPGGICVVRSTDAANTLEVTLVVK